MKIVLDTNTLVSAIGWEGPPARILRACRAGRFDLITSPRLLEELTRIVTYPKLRVIAKHPELPEILKWLHAAEHLVYPKKTVGIITVDPPDNRILECAVEGRADLIVSGNRHLLRLKLYEGIPIVRPIDFLRTLGVALTKQP